MREKQVTVLARFQAKKGMEERVREEIMALVAPTRSEPGCINYDLHQSFEEEGLFVLYENWVSKEALDQHLEMPHLVAFKEKAPSLLAEPLDISLWRMISPNN
jgi:quinol monooxygenase YgiN